MEGARACLHVVGGLEHRAASQPASKRSASLCVCVCVCYVIICGNVGMYVTLVICSVCYDCCEYCDSLFPMLDQVPTRDGLDLLENIPVELCLV